MPNMWSNRRRTSPGRGGRIFQAGQADQLADERCGTRQRPRKALAFVGLMCCVAAALPALGDDSADGTNVVYGAADAPYVLTLFGDLGCPEGTPHLAEWWQALQDPAVAPLTRVEYRHAPKKATKNTKFAAHAALAAGQQGEAYFFQTAARICEIVRENPKKKLNRGLLSKEVAKLGINKKQYEADYKKNKKQNRTRVDADERRAAQHFAKANAPLYLVNGKPVAFETASAFPAWVLEQEQAKAAAAETEKKALEEPALLPVLQVAVYEILATDVTPTVSFVVRDALTAELRKLARVSVISMDEVRTMLSYEADKKTLGCDSDSCLNEIAEALGVDVIITGALSAVGDKTYLTLKRIEQQKGTVSQQYSKTLEPAGGEEFLAVLGDAVATLFPERAPRTGQQRGVDTSMVARLKPPPLAPAVFWTSVAVTGSALAMSAMSGVMTLSQYQEFDALRTGQTPPPVSGSQLGAYREGTEQWQTYTWGALLTTGALASVTGVVAAFTNWDEESVDAARTQP